jgi:Fe2+ or Zn2+ uptake regulation protein
MGKTIYKGTEIWTDERGNSRHIDIVSKQFDAMDKKGWRRAIIGDLMEVLEQIGNKKIKVMEFLIDNMNSNNEINLSQREVEQATGISIKTINETFKALVTANFLKKIKRRYVLNTQIISAFGSGDKNRMLCVEYGFDSNFKQSETMEEKLLKIQAQQEQLKRDEAFLKKILENKAS